MKYVQIDVSFLAEKLAIAAFKAEQALRLEIWITGNTQQDQWIWANHAFEIESAFQFRWSRHGARDRRPEALMSGRRPQHADSGLRVEAGEVGVLNLHTAGEGEAIVYGFQFVLKKHTVDVIGGVVRNYVERLRSLFDE